MGGLCFLIAAGAMVAGLVAAQARAQSFILSQNGKSVGSADLAIKQAGGGFDATSKAKVDMPGLKYNFSEHENLDGSYHLQNVQLKGSVNGTSASVDTAPQGQQFAMKIDASGKVTNTPLAFHPQAVFYPDFDPAALQVMLNLGAAHNNRDLWAIVPKQSGSVAALRIATKPDESGTLDGKPVVVHHYTVTTPAETTEVFSGPSNQLLQAEWTSEGFAMVRKGFVINPPAKPRTPPPAQQPTAAGTTPQGAAGQAGPAAGSAPQPQ